MMRIARTAIGKAPLPPARPAMCCGFLKLRPLGRERAFIHSTAEAGTGSGPPQPAGGGGGPTGRSGTPASCTFSPEAQTCRRAQKRLQ
ncbi:hypothetical protein NCCP1664_19890 [Zafaria cholistanensis]|uniref:Uncharacterized protein n=1 Tax=Zafaria cholistanensis TaxID=1682741 RepID=A0A5A7NRM1_9MICC|nr:hypothetical protein NCCP1664_19890 [Zafaria cholistanensis]